MPRPKVYITGHPENQRFLGKRRYSADFDAREVKFVRSKKAYKYGKIGYNEIFLPKSSF